MVVSISLLKALWMASFRNSDYKELDVAYVCLCSSRSARTVNTIYLNCFQSSSSEVFRGLRLDIFNKKKNFKKYYFRRLSLGSPTMGEKKNCPEKLLKLWLQDEIKL